MKVHLQIRPQDIYLDLEKIKNIFLIFIFNSVVIKIGYD